jgi:hypothetical protein
MSFQGTVMGDGVVSTTAVTLGTTTFDFASSDLVGAQKAIITPSGASLRLGIGTAPTTLFGIQVTSGTNYEVVGAANVARVQLISITTSSTVTVQLFR